MMQSLSSLAVGLQAALLIVVLVVLAPQCDAGQLSIIVCLEPALHAVESVVLVSAHVTDKRILGLCWILAQDS